MKDFCEQNYQHTQKVRLVFKNYDGSLDICHDEIKGLNKGHALYLAKKNWPCAVEITAEQQV